jgi:8-oxo-dGTP pyrophosphatase MutT (NUDIX family)
MIELPAGLVDEGETAEQAAIRELEEETGYVSDKVLDSTAVLATDPGRYRNSHRAADCTPLTILTDRNDYCQYEARDT